MSNTYIKLSTKEYPRHIGDIQIDPSGSEDYSPVSWVDKPDYNILTQVCYEISPIEIDGNWQMQWFIRDMTQQEIDSLAKINAQTPAA